MIEPSVTVYDGKYTFVCPHGDWRIHVLRYDEPWLIIEEGHKAVLALMGELLEAREKAAPERFVLAGEVERLRAELESLRVANEFNCEQAVSATERALKAEELLRDMAEGVCTTLPYAARAAALLGKEDR